MAWVCMIPPWPLIEGRLGALDLPVAAFASELPYALDEELHTGHAAFGEETAAGVHG